VDGSKCDSVHAAEGVQFLQQLLSGHAPLDCLAELPQPVRSRMRTSSAGCKAKIGYIAYRAIPDRLVYLVGCEIR
jgi:hypothetical protein